MEIDFTVYAQRQIPYIDKHTRRGQRAWTIVKEPLSRVVSEAVRRRLEAIPELWWLTIYESVETCGAVNGYGLPVPAAGSYCVASIAFA